MLTIEELISRAKCNDKDAILALWLHYKKLAFKICQKFTAHMPMDDLMQEAFILLLDTVRSFETDKGYKFSTIYTNTLKWGLIRKTRRLQRVKEYCILDKPLNDDNETTMGDMVADDTAEFETASLDKITASGLYQKCISLFPKDNDTYLKLFIMRYIQGLTIKKISEKLNMSIYKTRAADEKIYQIIVKNKELQYMADDIIGLSYRKGGLEKFKNTNTSSTEWAALKIMFL